jgi:hypothetical protein
MFGEFLWKQLWYKALPKKGLFGKCLPFTKVDFINEISGLGH